VFSLILCQHLGIAIKDHLPRTRLVMSVSIYLFLPLFCSSVSQHPSPSHQHFLVLLISFPPLFFFYYYSLSVSGMTLGPCIEMKGWQEGWGCISTQKQQWKVMCGDKTSQWCFCVELGCLYYVLPPRRCLMRYPAGLWVVAEIGMIDFPTLHNAGQLKLDCAVSST